MLSFLIASAASLSGPLGPSFPHQRQSERRQKGTVKVGVYLPNRQEIKAIVEHVTGRWRPLIITAILTGLRASELRGLRREDVDFDARQVHVRQRADKFNQIGPPKSEAGERTVPLPPLVVRTLKEWKAGLPKGRTRARVFERQG